MKPDYLVKPNEVRENSFTATRDVTIIILPNEAEHQRRQEGQKDSFSVIPGSPPHGEERDNHEEECLSLSTCPVESNSKAELSDMCSGRQTSDCKREESSLGKSGGKTDGGRAQAPEKPGKRLDSLKETLLFPKLKEIQGSSTKTSEQPLLSSLPALFLWDSGLLLFTLINPTTVVKPLPCECP